MIVAVFLLLTAMPWPAQAQEVIRTFRAKIEVMADSSLKVTEAIRVRAQGREIKRGIYRDFPTLHRFPDGSLKSTTFEVLGVYKNGQPEPYHLKDIAAGQRVYIGRENVFIEPGEYTYTIQYLTHRQLRHFPGFDELYWNVTGNHWSFPIESAEAQVVLPQGAIIQSYNAYTGPEGAQGQQYKAQSDDQGGMVFRTTRSLARHEGLTIAVSWPKGFVSEPSAAERQRQFWADNGHFVFGMICLAGVFFYYIVVWMWFGRDPARKTVIPLFEPPENMSPALCDYVYTLGGLSWKEAFAATILNLAVKGYVKIQKTSESVLGFSIDKFSLEKGRPDARSAFEEERSVATHLLGAMSSGSLALSSVNQAVVQGAFKALQKETKKIEGGRCFKTNAWALVLPWLVSGAFFASLFLQGDLDEGLTLLIHGTAFGGFFIYLGLSALFSRKIIIKIFGFIGGFGAYLGLLALCYYFSAELNLDGRAVVAHFSMLCINVLFIHLMKAPTPFGRAIMDQIEGFKLFLSVAEKERFEALHPPDITPEIFEKYLPYAVALGVENSWAKKFERTLSERMDAGSRADYSPSWYSGGHFSAGSLAVATASFTAALSSSAASASGSSGGGSSGGGGGGGGGGGW